MENSSGQDLQVLFLSAYPSRYETYELASFTLRNNESRDTPEFLNNSYLILKSINGTSIGNIYITVRPGIDAQAVEVDANADRTIVRIYVSNFGVDIYIDSASN